MRKGKEKNREKFNQYNEDNKQTLQNMNRDYYRWLFEEERIKNRVCKKLVLEIKRQLKSKEIWKRIQINLISRYMWRRKTWNKMAHERIYERIQKTCFDK